MDFLVESAKNHEYTLIMNGIYLYSKYSPKKSLSKSVTVTTNKDVLLIGLGLGYAAETCLHQLHMNQHLYVCYLDVEECTLTEKYGVKDLFNDTRVTIIHIEALNKLDLASVELIIPLSYMKAIRKDHPLYRHLEDIKVKQLAYENASHKMKANFERNRLLKCDTIKDIRVETCKISVLAASGPSLAQHLPVIKEVREQIYLFCVGSALKLLLSNDIVPDFIVISDSDDKLGKQFSKDYDIPLIFLATANNEALKRFKGKRYIAFQDGLSYTEAEAESNNVPVVSTGGSVATVAISIIELLGFSKLILFGQDLGFEGAQTHSEQSSSNRQFNSDIHFQKTLSNRKKDINTTSSWLIYKKWIEQKIEHTNMKLYNIAENGAKIKGCPYITEKEFIQLAK